VRKIWYTFCEGSGQRYSDGGISQEQSQPGLLNRMKFENVKTATEKFKIYILLKEIPEVN